MPPECESFPSEKTYDDGYITNRDCSLTMTGGVIGGRTRLGPAVTMGDAIILNAQVKATGYDCRTDDGSVGI